MSEETMNSDANTNHEDWEDGLDDFLLRGSEYEDYEPQQKTQTRNESGRGASTKLPPAPTVEAAQRETIIQAVSDLERETVNLGRDAQYNEEFTNLSADKRKKKPKAFKVRKGVRKTLGVLNDMAGAAFEGACMLTGGLFVCGLATIWLLSFYHPKVVFTVRTIAAEFIKPHPAPLPESPLSPAAAGLVPGPMVNPAGIQEKELDPNVVHELMIGSNYPALVRFPGPIKTIKNHNPDDLAIKKETSSEFSVEARSSDKPNFNQMTKSGSIWVELNSGETMVLHVTVAGGAFLGKTDILTFYLPEEDTEAEEAETSGPQPGSGASAPGNKVNP